MVPAKPAPARKRPAASPLARCGCLVSLLAMLTCAAATVVIGLAEYREDSDFNAGVSAFNRGDCDQALPHFQAVVDGTDYGVVEHNSDAEQMRNECLAFQQAAGAELEGNPGEALAGYLDFDALYPSSGLTNFVIDRIAALFEASTVEQLAVDEACDRLSVLEDAALLPQPAEQLPQMLFYCAHTYRLAGEFDNALSFFDRLLSEFPEFALADEAEDVRAQIRIEMARASGAQEITAPEASGVTSAGSSTYIVTNDSQELIRITLRGPETITDEIAPCQDCPKFTEPPDECPDRGLTEQYTLTPGSYEVLVESVSDDNVTPYVGDWEFESGFEYADCYYIVTR